jgi:hypothetical protein
VSATGIRLASVFDGAAWRGSSAARGHSSTRRVGPCTDGQQALDIEFVATLSPLAVSISQLTATRVPPNCRGAAAGGTGSPLCQIISTGSDGRYDGSCMITIHRRMHVARQRTLVNRLSRCDRRASPTTRPGLQRRQLRRRYSPHPSGVSASCVIDRVTVRVFLVLTRNLDGLGHDADECARPLLP